MTDIPRPPAAPRRRIDLIDVLRGVALIAMAAYHFTWDLDFFGYVPRGMATEGGWKLFARGIASSFLFLVGISLVLAHGRGIRWRAFRLREAQVAAGALAITLATWFATPDSFVFFGILHQIAVASLLGLLFLRLPWAVTALAGIGTIALPLLFETSFTEPKALSWIGFAARWPVTNDYVPIFPWTGVVLLGIAAGRLLDRAGAWVRLAALNPRLRPLRPLAALGRHALLFYLLHQPVLYGLVFAAATAFPPDRTAQFAAGCRHDFADRLDAARLNTFCDCVETRLRAEALLKPLLDGTATPAQTDAVRQTSLQCSFALPPSPPDAP